METLKKEKPKGFLSNYKVLAIISCLVELVAFTVLFGYVVSNIPPMASKSQLLEKEAIENNAVNAILSCFACFVFALILATLSLLSGIAQGKSWLMIPYIGFHVVVAFFILNTSVMVVIQLIQDDPYKTLQICGGLGSTLIIGWILLKPVMVHYVDLTLENAKDEVIIAEMRSIEKQNILSF